MINNKYRALASLCAGIAEDKQADNIVVWNVEKLIDITDFFVTCSANNERQIKGIKDSIHLELKKYGILPLAIQGDTTSSWVVMDYCEFIVHIFKQEMRDYYEFDGLWADAPKIRWKMHLRKFLNKA